MHTRSHHKAVVVLWRCFELGDEEKYSEHLSLLILICSSIQQLYHWVVAVFWLLPNSSNLFSFVLWWTDFTVLVYWLTTWVAPYCRLFIGTSFDFYESQSQPQTCLYCSTPLWYCDATRVKINSYSELISGRRKQTGKDSPRAKECYYFTLMGSLSLVMLFCSTSCHLVKLHLLQEQLGLSNNIEMHRTFVYSDTF